MKDEVQITIFSYKLEEWEETIIRKCIADHPSFDLEEVAEVLGIHVRTLYRKVNHYNINTSVVYRKNLLKLLKMQYK